MIFRNIVSILCWLMIMTVADAMQHDTTVVKGSYVFYGVPGIEDNSMLIDEAINQSAGYIQAVSSFVLARESSRYQIDIEIPLAGEKHQVSLSLPYCFQSVSNQNTSDGKSLLHGIGDLSIGYRALVMDRTKWCLLAPGLTLITPSGNYQRGFSEGRWGTLLKIAMTKRLNLSLTAHLNMETLLSYPKKDNETTALSSAQSRKILFDHTLGLGMVWAMRSDFNLMLESACSSKKEGSFRRGELTVNPAFRFSIKAGKVQVVPGFGFPLYFGKNGIQRYEALFYLSIEACK
jgi:hypothetical protein